MTASNTATTRERIAIAVENARGMAASFADKFEFAKTIQRELRLASSLMGAKLFINDRVVFEQPAKPAPTREPIKTGEYGRVTFDFVKHGSAWLDVINPHLGMTADELREAAHMFNQIAEVLEQQP
jgi:hypothetical protein